MLASPAKSDRRASSEHHHIPCWWGTLNCSDSIKSSLANGRNWNGSIFLCLCSHDTGWSRSACNQSLPPNVSACEDPSLCLTGMIVMREENPLEKPLLLFCTNLQWKPVCFFRSHISKLRYEWEWSNWNSHGFSPVHISVHIIVIVKTTIEDSTSDIQWKVYGTWWFSWYLQNRFKQYWKESTAQ